MKRLTTDCATGNFEVSMNYVFGKDGWAHIVSDGEHENVPLTTWAKEQCIKRGCDEFPGETPGEIDQTLCDCIADSDGCPIALAYCFATQACHLRTRLKQDEDTGLTPEEIMGLYSMDKRARMVELLRTEDNRPLTLEQLREMDGEPPFEQSGIYELTQATKDGRPPVTPKTKTYDAHTAEAEYLLGVLWNGLHTDGMATKAADRVAEIAHEADKVQQATKQKNEPLTPEELREMDGEPVWICDPDGSDGMWALVDLEYELCRTAKGGIAIFDTYGKTWLAYRRKPEGGEAPC